MQLGDFLIRHGIVVHDCSLCVSLLTVWHVPLLGSSLLWSLAFRKELRLLPKGPRTSFEECLGFLMEAGVNLMLMGLPLVASGASRLAFYPKAQLECLNVQVCLGQQSLEPGVLGPRSFSRLASSASMAPF